MLNKKNSRKKSNFIFIQFNFSKIFFNELITRLTCQQFNVGCASYGADDATIVRPMREATVSDDVINAACCVDGRHRTCWYGPIDCTQFGCVLVLPVSQRRKFNWITHLWGLLLYWGYCRSPELEDGPIKDLRTLGSMGDWRAISHQNGHRCWTVLCPYTTKQQKNIKYWTLGELNIEKTCISSTPL